MMLSNFEGEKRAGQIMSDVERQVLFNTVFTEKERPRIDE